MTNDLQQIRFLATNYPNLKGLQMSVIGFMVLSVALWVNTQPGPNSNLTIPLTIMLITVILSFGVERYYWRTFGRVKPDKDTQLKKVVVSILGGLLGIMSFAIDALEILPISTMGIVFALALLYEYWRFNRSAPDKSLSSFLWFTLVLFVVSILPIFGFDEFWSRLGFVNAMVGVLTLTGILMIIIMGLMVHFFLVRSMPPRMEVSNDEPV
jgi:hypothetical protein